MVDAVKFFRGGDTCLHSLRVEKQAILVKRCGYIAYNLVVRSLVFCPSLLDAPLFKQGKGTLVESKIDLEVLVVESSVNEVTNTVGCKR